MRRVLALVFALAAPAGAAERFPASLVPLLLRQSVCSNSPLTACSGGGAGAVTAGGNNTFTGTNIFQDQAKFQIQNQADATKVFEFNLGSMTTGNTVVAFVGGTSAAPTWGTSGNPWTNIALTVDGGTSPSLNWYSGGATQGGLSFTGVPSGTVFTGTNGTLTMTSSTIETGSGQAFCWASTVSTTSAGCDTFFRRRIGANVQQGAADAASPVAQVFSVQSVVGGNTNVAGVDRTFQGSLQTGNAEPGRQYIDTGIFSVTSGSTQATALHSYGFGFYKTLTNNTVTTILNMTDASNTVAGVVVKYACQVFNGTDLQFEIGEASCSVINKGGVFSGNACTKFGTQAPAPTSGTLTVTLSVTGANPAAVQINCNSSLTPNAGYPILGLDFENLGNQAVVVVP